MKASIIIPNRNDTVMLGVTVRTILENIRDIDAEIIIVDNSDDDIYAVLKKRNVSPIPLGYIDEGRMKLIRQDFPSMYAAAETGANIANGEYLFKCDSHVMWGANVVKDCIEFMDSHPNAGCCSSPINWINRRDDFACSEIGKSADGGVFGGWKRSKLPKKISWGFGYRVIRKDWYNEINGFSFFANKRISWGGGEFYLSMKSWLMGKENWSIKTNPVYHIGPHAKELEKLTGYKFRVYVGSGNGKVGLGILAAFYALGGNEAKEECKKSAGGLKSQYGIDIDRDWPLAREFAKEDHEWILEHQKISFKELLEKEPWNEC